MIALGIISYFRKRKEEKKRKSHEEFAEFYKKCLNKWAKENEETTKKYNEFVNSTKEKVGMTIRDLKELYPQIKMTQLVYTSSSKKTLCSNCGGIVINGKCQYCGSEYIDNSDVIILSYQNEFGTKKYIFKHGVLNSIEVNAKPLEDFLNKLPKDFKPEKD